MSTLLVTVFLAFIIVIVAIALLAIGWLATGKSRIRPGACGRAPQRDRDGECGTNSTCSLCKREDSKDKNEKLQQK